MWCAADPSLWGNWSGLLGTAVLGLGTFMAYPIARRLYRYSRALLDLNEERRKQAAQPVPTDEFKDVDEKKLAAALQKLKEHEENVSKAFEESHQYLAVQQGRRARFNLWLFVGGFVLTLASYGLPLFMPKCPLATTAITVSAASQ